MYRMLAWCTIVVCLLIFLIFLHTFIYISLLLLQHTTTHDGVQLATEPNNMPYVSFLSFLSFYLHIQVSGYYYGTLRHDDRRGMASDATHRLGEVCSRHVTIIEFYILIAKMQRQVNEVACQCYQNVINVVMCYQNVVNHDVGQTGQSVTKMKCQVNEVSSVLSKYNRCSRLLPQCNKCSHVLPKCSVSTVRQIKQHVIEM